MLGSIWDLHLNGGLPEAKGVEWRPCWPWLLLGCLLQETGGSQEIEPGRESQHPIGGGVDRAESWQGLLSLQGVPALALPEAGGAAQHPQHGAALPLIPVRALCGHLTSCEAAGGGPDLPEPGYAGPGKERGEWGQQALEVVPGWAREAGTTSAPRSGAHTSPQSLPGQSYEVQMLCNSKLGDTTQWPQLLKVGASPPRSGKG